MCLFDAQSAHFHLLWTIFTFLDQRSYYSMTPIIGPLCLLPPPHQHQHQFVQMLNFDLLNASLREGSFKKTNIFGPQGHANAQWDTRILWVRKSAGDGHKISGWWQTSITIEKRIISETMKLKKHSEQTAGCCSQYKVYRQHVSPERLGFWNK